MATTAIADTVRDAVQSILDAWIAGVEQENLSLLAQIVAPDEDAVFNGDAMKDGHVSLDFHAAADVHSGIHEHAAP